jgi:hypothetical protein
MADDGEVAFVEPTSEGGCDVEGVSVSISEGASNVDPCESSRPSVGVNSGSTDADACESSRPSAGVNSGSTWASGTSDASSSTGWSRIGKARPSSLASTGPLLRFFFCDALGGNGASGTDSQGSGGWKGFRGGDDCSGGGAEVAGEVVEGVLDSTFVVVMAAGGVGELTRCRDATEGDEGAGCGVWLRMTGGACEWAMGGVCTSERLM